MQTGEYRNIAYVGCREGHDRQAGDQRRDQVTDPRNAVC